MSSKSKQAFIAGLPRRVLQHYFHTKERLKIKPDELPHQDLLSKRGSFVIFHTKSGDLRGCSGKIEGKKQLYKDLIDNALLAALRDTRFPALTQKELDSITIEVALLTKPKKVRYKTIAELFEKVAPGKQGVVLEKQGHRATFLPQVWKLVPSQADFFTSLSVTAGLNPKSWQEEDAVISVYEVEEYREE